MMATSRTRRNRRHRNTGRNIAGVFQPIKYLQVYRALEYGSELRPLEDPSLVEPSLVSGYLAGLPLILVTLRRDFGYPRRDGRTCAEPVGVRRSVAVSRRQVGFALGPT